jgi:primosomal protein N' (replication factor Y)
MPGKKAAKNLVNVAVMTAIRGPLTYSVPESIEVRAGQRVLVPLATRKVMGVALDPARRDRLAPGVKVRDLLRVVDPEPILSPELLTLGLWMAEYYLAPVGEVFRAMVPLRAESRRTRWLQITEKGRRRLEELTSSLLEESRSGEEAALLSYVAKAGAAVRHAGLIPRGGTAPAGSVAQPSWPSPNTGGTPVPPGSRERTRDGPKRSRGRAPLAPTTGVGGASLEAVRRRFSSRLAGSADLLDRAIAEGLIVVIEIERERRKTLAVRLADSVLSALAHGPLPERPFRLSPVAQRIVETLRQQGPVSNQRNLLKSARASLGHLRKLSEVGLLEITSQGSKFETRKSRLALQDAGGAASMGSALPELTVGQAAVVGELTSRLANSEFSVVLLHGITASGKTEIYLRLIAQCLEGPRTALLLVPEIALTPGMQAQFQARFGNRVAVLHSALGKIERDEEWRRAGRGEARMVLGTRSAVFAPLPDLGLLIVDEEHEASYKQEETPRYHGRDVAVMRGRLSKALVVLGSATPSLESYWNAQEGKYYLATLPERVHGRPLAAVEIVDMREEFRQTFTQIPISRRLKAEIEVQLSSGAQTMILLNRRGYSWFLLCRACGETQRCVNCSISLTYHRRERRLICHYCGYSAELPSRCPHCASEYLHYVGEGTEKIEDKLAELFPDARVARLDRDIARRVGQYQRLLGAFRQGKIDILVGTQLIAKGHDFPGVTLVGVVSVDQGLALPDFRAAERTFQLLTQAAGRAGRGDTPGRVLVQTFYPEHYAVRLAADQNYGGFFSKEMRFRRMMHYPPVTALANVIAQDRTLEQAARVANEIGRFFAAAEDESPNVKILGPTPAPLAKLEGRFRIQFLLKANSRARLNTILRGLADHCERAGISPHSVMIDVDPVSVM